MRNRPFLFALAALACGVMARLGAGLASGGHDGLRHPVAWLGAEGMPHAAGFNLFGFLVPGLLLAVALWGVRGRMVGEGWTARIGITLGLLSALAYAALGVFPLDASGAPGPGHRLHAVAWSLWWIAFAPAALLVALGARTRGPWRPALLLACVLMPLLLLWGAGWLPVGLAQSLACLVWGLAWVGVARRAGVQP